MKRERFPWSSEVDRLNELPEERLPVLRSEIECGISPLREAFDTARRKAAVERVFVDSAWYTRTQAQLREMGLDVQRVQSEQARRRSLRRRDAEANNERLHREYKLERSSFERRFVDAAKLILPARLFRDICRASSGTIPTVQHPDRETGSPEQDEYGRS
jgi:hypothetical protein